MKANAAICYEDLDEKRSEIKANLEDMIAGFEKIAAYDFCGCEEAEATKTDLKKVISTFKCAAEAFNSANIKDINGALDLACENLQKLNNNLENIINTKMA